VIDHWIQDFPALQKEAITTALDRASLTKARRAVRLLEELDAKFRGPVPDDRNTGLRFSGVGAISSRVAGGFPRRF